MKKLLSILLFIAFLTLSGLEVVPKFYQKALNENTDLLFVAKTRKNVSEIDSKVEQGPNGPEGKGDNETSSDQIDYKKLIQNIDTKGS